MNPALFLDRDGVINREIGNYITNINDFEVNPSIFPLIQGANKSNAKVIVVTNQGGIAKGLYSLETLLGIHQKMIDILYENGCYIDAIYFCPHHPEYNGNCLCRKPDSLLIEKAIHRYQVDITKSIFIGDNERDIRAANKVGVKSILIPSNDLSSLSSLDWQFQ